MATSSERLRLVIPVLAVLLAVPVAAGQATQGGALPAPLPLFPPDNWWNVDVSAAPLDPNSAALISFIGASKGLHPDLGGDSSPYPQIYGMPYIVVPGSEPLEAVAFDYADESDPGAPGRPAGYPIPVEAISQPKWIEGGYPGNATVGGDKHMLIVDKDNRVLFETWNTRFNVALDRWEAGSGAVFLLDSNQRRPDGWTSSDAAGLAILPGLIRYDEVYGSDPIRHAFRFTVRATNGYVYPASHRAGSTTGAPPMGTRLRLKASKDISGYSADVRKIFQAMKTYGLIVADNGTDMYVQGTYDTGWDNDVLNPAFASLHASDFEVVQLGWKPPLETASGPTSFYTLTPCRVADTRNAAGPYGGPAIPPGSQRVYVLAEVCGIPATAKAVSANVTAVTPSSAGSFRFFPGDDQPGVPTTMSFAAERTRANNLVMKLSGSGSGTVGVASTGPAPVHMVIDVNGFFQ
jgi:hypothetical protein